MLRLNFAAPVGFPSMHPRRGSRACHRPPSWSRISRRFSGDAPYALALAGELHLDEGTKGSGIEFMRRLCLSLILSATFSSPSLAEPLRVAVASNFLMPARALAQRFEQLSGRQVAVSTGSTGKLYAQIVNGAPYSIFLAANATEPRRLETDGRAVPGTRMTYATGRLVLWSMDEDLLKAGEGPDLIRRGDFTRLAIANPKTAPYGAAALQTMRSLKLDTKALRSRLARGENVSQAYQFIATGNADLGFIALSQVNNPERPAGGSHWLVPVDLHDPIEQQAVLLTRGADDRDARAFLDFLRSPEALEVIAAYGYGAG